jgi:phage replication-related protein YjqB (UPF0714/DUF867 family)
VPPGDVHALATALHDLLCSSEQLQAMGAASYHLAQERFDERRVFATVQATYRRLLDAHGIVVPVQDD